MAARQRAREKGRQATRDLPRARGRPAASGSDAGPDADRSTSGKHAAPPAAPAETELKLAVPATALALLRARLLALGRGSRAQLETTYFDTADLLLARHGMALRLRRLGARWVQTLKTGAVRAAFSTRGEWETPVTGARLQLARLRASPLPALLKAHGAPPLRPLFTTRFVRTQRTVAVGRSLVEVALDQGQVVVGRGRAAQRLPLLELELELKSGRSRALFKLARQLMAGEGDGDAQLPLLPFSESKAGRGYRLLAGKPLAPVKAAAKGFAAPLRPEMSADAALRKVIGHGADVLLANAQGLAEHDEPEFVHQARVALRRMRSAVRLWRKRSRFPARLAAELQWIGRALGAARDADVLVGETLPHLAAGLGAIHAQPLLDLTATAQARRAQARAAAREALASGRFARLALDLLAWAHDESANEKKAAAKADALQRLAPRQLARALRKLRAAARFFVALSPERRHAVRILAKRLRYALDLFAVTLPAQPTSAYIERLAQLQDLLGELNDVAVARATLVEFGAAPALRGAIEATLAAREAGALQQAEAELHALFDLPSPWD
jgi:inorganic triphosphatase YgiF